MSVDGSGDRTAGRSPRLPLGRDSRERAFGQTRWFGPKGMRWDTIVTMLAVILAVVMATLAILAQRNSPSGAKAGTIASPAKPSSTSHTSSTTVPAFPHLIHTIGHSFTSSGAEAQSVAKLLGPSWTYTTSGVGMDTALGIAARAGAVPWELHPTGGQIPATGKVEVTLFQNGKPYPEDETWPLIGNAAGENTRGTGQNNEGTVGILGTLAGISGRLLIDRPYGTAPMTSHTAGDRYFFERDSPGDDVVVTDAAFLPSYVQSQLGGVVLINAARNSLPQTDISAVIATIDKIIALVPSDRWLVLAEWSGEESLTSEEGKAVIDYNAQAKAHWGDHFVDTYTFARDKGLDFLTLPPTPDDVQDISEGKIPRTLQRNDHLHPNERGYEVIARCVVDQMIKLGLVPAGT